MMILRLSWWLSGKESASAGDEGSTSGLGRYTGEGNVYPLQYSCLENSWTEEPGRLQSMDHKESDMTERVRARARTHTHTHTLTHLFDYKHMMAGLPWWSSG